MGLKAVELFAGVGGFRQGLKPSGWDVVLANQWEPGRKHQWAFDCYEAHFGRDPDRHFNVDIANLSESDVPKHDLLVGGFPCQDYSVATTKASGIQGKKGVLWWQIQRLVEAKKPRHVLLENVDRLLRSPTTQRGRDFGIILSCFDALGYSVEWRVINAADYGAPQKRRRTFLLASRNVSVVHKSLRKEKAKAIWLTASGFFATEFGVTPVPKMSLRTADLPEKLQAVSDGFRFDFDNAGVMLDGKIWSQRVKPAKEFGRSLGDVLQPNASAKYYIASSELPRWQYLKGAKSEPRKARNGFQYHYSEGPLPYPDDLDGPSRTILTSEGGTSPSRFKHIVRDPETRKMRVLTPVEVELLNQFPKDWTHTGMPENWRYFCMGNALVVGLVERMGMRLRSIIEETPSHPHLHSTIPESVAWAGK